MDVDLSVETSVAKPPGMTLWLYPQADSSSAQQPHGDIIRKGWLVHPPERDYNTTVPTLLHPPTEPCMWTTNVGRGSIAGPQKDGLHYIFLQRHDSCLSDQTCCCQPQQKGCKTWLNDHREMTRGWLVLPPVVRKKMTRSHIRQSMNNQSTGFAEAPLPRPSIKMA